MSVTPVTPRYDLVVQTADGQSLYLRELLRSLQWEESLDEAAVRLKTELLAPLSRELAAYLRGSQGVTLTGIPFGESEAAELWRGVVWEAKRGVQRAPTVPPTLYDHLVFATKTEDDFLYEPGQTATQIIRDSANQWGISLGTLAETGIALKRQVARGATLWKLWNDAVKETAKKGGALFRPRMNAGQLELVRLGSNSTVWLLEIGVNIYEAEEQWSRDAVVTKAKVVGNASSEFAAREVLAVEQDAGLIQEYGTIQRILSDPDVKTAGDASTLAKQALRGPEEGFTLSAPDINTLRAGDAMVVRDEDGNDYSLLVDQVTHDGSKGPGKMTLTLATEQQIRWRWVAP